MSKITVERDGALARVTLNRPDKLNALSTAVEAELLAALSSPEVTTARVLVVRGEGRAFCAGADTEELDAATPASALAYYTLTGDVYERLASLHVPSIAQIHGWCVGGGLELALACDLRVASADARFWFPEVERGILPSSGGTARIVQACGPAVARRLILLGEKFDAPEALRLGVIQAIGDGDVAEQWAATLAERSAAAIQVTRAAISAATDGSHAAATAVERIGYAALAGIPAK